MPPCLAGRRTPSVQHSHLPVALRPAGPAVPRSAGFSRLGMVLRRIGAASSSVERPSIWGTRMRKLTVGLESAGDRQAQRH